MPPRKRTPPVKAAARASVTPEFTEPATDNDNIEDWQDRQPVVTVEDPGELRDYFPGDEENTTRPSERAPKIPSPVATKARGVLDRVKQAAKGQPTRKTRAAKPRVSVDKVIGTGWQLLAQLAAPINLPVARVLDMQAPVAGMLLEDVVKNTVVDRILQPLARAETGGEMAFALMAPPLLVGVLSQRPELGKILVPVLRQSLMSWMEIAGPKLEQVRKKEEEFQEKYGMQVDVMIAYFMGAIPQPTAEDSPNGSQHGHSATFTVSTPTG